MAIQGLYRGCPLLPGQRIEVSSLAHLDASGGGAEIVPALQDQGQGRHRRQQRSHGRKPGRRHLAPPNWVACEKRSPVAAPAYTSNAVTAGNNG